MSLKILKEYKELGICIREYTKDGDTVSCVIKTPIQTEPIEPLEPEPSIEEQILTENQYQTALLEMNTMGGAV